MRVPVCIPTTLVMVSMLKASSGFSTVTMVGDSMCRHATERVDVIAADDQFSRDDSIIAVVSMNLLAPFYQHLGLLRQNQTKALAEEMIRNDRLVRVPCAVEQAAKSRPDILLLQEVEGGNHPDLLVESTLKNLGYNGYVWSSLYPDRAVKTNDCVGLAVAFDQDRFDCIRQEAFRRGQIVHLVDQDSNRDILLANLHLNAKPSAIEARLHAVSNCMRCIEAMLASSHSTTALVILGGDLNCEHPSVTTRLITAGSVPFGTVRDRNYKAKLTKATAKNLRHSLRFEHVYNGVFDAAPVTVALTGRGPGIMDHLFVCTSTCSDRTTSTRTKITPSISGSKRRSRRQRALYSSTVDNHKHSQRENKLVSVKAVLATVGSDDQYQTIIKGIPNMQAGFSSDHLAIGVAFSETSVERTPQEKEPTSIFVRATKSHSSLSYAASRRREAFRSSSLIRRRHNLVLQAIAEWLPPGSTKDKSLEHLEVPDLRKKSRAPDICCVIGGTLFVIEVTVVSATNRERAVRIKKRKYADLPIALQSSPTVIDRDLTISDIIVLAFDDRGKADPSTVSALRTLDLAMQHESIRGKNLTLEQVMRSIEDVVQGEKVELL